MALRDQPYLPLYIQDVLTDEKLIVCSAEAHGIYFRLLCILHKQEEYGEIKLKSKYNTDGDIVLSFAKQLAIQMPFPTEIVVSGIKELVEEGVVSIDETQQTLYQKRMQHDGRISKTRKECGKLGRNASTANHGQPGYLYLMSDGIDKHKIGVSKSPTSRLYRLRSDNKLNKNFEIKEMMQVEDMGKVESKIQEYFAYIIDNEWLSTDIDTLLAEYKVFASTFLLEQNTQQKQKFAPTFAGANTAANTENEYENNIVSNNIITNQDNNNNIYNIYTGEKSEILPEQKCQQKSSEQKQKQKSEPEVTIPNLRYETIFGMPQKERSEYLISVFENRLPFYDAYRCAWNIVAISHGLASIGSINDATKGKIAKMIKLPDFDFKTLLAKCVEKVTLNGESVYVRPHLVGDNDRGWKITFDWLFTSNKDRIPNYYNVLYNNAYVRGGVVVPTKVVTK